jgi:uncharacterized protein (DUF1697 family)
MVYLALLRGINVGGKSKVEMPKLKLAFESLGCKNVLTYINSGNVIFCDQRKINELVPIIKKAIIKNFGFEVKIVLRDLANIRKLCQEIPSHWTNDIEQKTDVIFLFPEVDSPEILNKIVINPDLENVRYVSGALVWNIGRKNVTKGSGIKLIKSNIYPLITIRNINTVRKLHTLMGNIQDKST